MLYPPSGWMPGRVSMGLDKWKRETIQPRASFANFLLTDQIREMMSFRASVKPESPAVRLVLVLSWEFRPSSCHQHQTRSWTLSLTPQEPAILFKNDLFLVSLPQITTWHSELLDLCFLSRPILVSELQAWSVDLRLLCPKNHYAASLLSLLISGLDLSQSGNTCCNKYHWEIKACHPLTPQAQAESMAQGSKPCSIRWWFRRIKSFPSFPLMT